MIKKIYYHKLIRDKIPEIIEKSGGSAKIEKLTSKQFEKELLKKVGEEASALPGIESKKELVDELTDVIEVVEEIKKFKKITEKEIKAEKVAHMNKKGGFKKKLYLVWSEDTGYRTNEKKYSKKK